MRHLLCLSLVASCFALGACDKLTEKKPEVEALPAIVPDLPEVPTLPPPPHPITYDDGSYSVYGLRRKIRDTIDQGIEVTGTIVEIYEAPPCTEKNEDDCPKVLQPHVWIADTPTESDRMNQLIVVGYAINQKEVDSAKRKAPKGASMSQGEMPIPVDFAVGNKIKASGRFTRISSGFNSSNGLLEYSGHSTLDKPGS